MATKKKTTKTAAKKAAPKKAAAKTTAAKSKLPMPVSKSTFGYTTSNIFHKMTVKKVWDAVMNPKVIEKLFADKQKGAFGPKLEPVKWFWKEWGDWTLYPTKYVKESEVVFVAEGWGSKTMLTIRFEFVKKDGKTIFRIHEQGHSKKDLNKVFMQLEGWTEFHCAIKHYLVTGKAVRIG